MGHIKGPWSWWPDCCRDGGMITTDANGGHIAAPTFFLKRPDLTAANSKLLAAAPDLLEACVVAEGLISKRDSHAEVDISEVLGILRGAIDKATGN